MSLLTLRFWLAMTALLVFTPLHAGASSEPLGGGALEGILDGERVVFPILKTEMRAQIQGDLATVRLTQVFFNPYDAPLHARYVFPLPPDAAVFAMRMLSGDRMIEAEIQRKQEARAIFEAAKQRGNQAALLSQTRPNVFVQKVANLLPGMPIRVELEYAHAVEKRGEDYEFHFPMVVGPRYLPDSAGRTPLHGDTEASNQTGDEPEPLVIGEWNLPASAPVADPEFVDRDRVELHVALEAGLPTQWVASPSHPLAQRDRATTHLANLERLERFDEFAILIIERVFEYDMFAVNSEHLATPHNGGVLMGNRFNLVNRNTIFDRGGKDRVIVLVDNVVSTSDIFIREVRTHPALPHHRRWHLDDTINLG